MRALQHEKSRTSARVCAQRRRPRARGQGLPPFVHCLTTDLRSLHATGECELPRTACPARGVEREAVASIPRAQGLGELVDAFITEHRRVPAFASLTTHGAEPGGAACFVVGWGWKLRAGRGALRGGSSAVAWHAVDSCAVSFDAWPTTCRRSRSISSYLSAGASGVQPKRDRLDRVLSLADRA